MADACLAYGARSCRAALAAVERIGRAAELGPGSAGARVIYGHTDSMCGVLRRRGGCLQCFDR